MSTSRDSIIMPIIIVAFNCLLLIECLPNNNRVSLHSLMTDKELLRYFDVDNPDEVSDAIYEVVEIAASPSSRSKRDLRSRDEIQLKVSGKHLRLNLEPNEDLLYEEARVLSVSSSAEEEIIESGVNASRSCHYRVRDLASNSITGGLSDLTGGECDGRNLFGFVYDSEEILEIHPLGEDLKEKAGINRRSHLIKKKPAKSVFELGDEIDKRAMSGNNKLIIELAIFVDVFAYKNLIDFYGGEQTKLVDLVLALVNGVEGIYRYPSLGRYLLQAHNLLNNIYSCYLGKSNFASFTWSFTKASVSTKVNANESPFCSDFAPSRRRKCNRTKPVGIWPCSCPDATCSESSRTPNARVTARWASRR